MEHHAVSLARAQPVSAHSVAVVPLNARVRDNYHLVEKQLEQIERDLPPGYDRQMPTRADGPFTGYPRVLGIAWAYVAQTDSLLNDAVIIQFIQ